jgi:hydrogenase nickel incorporation protein HypA/HybF
VHEYSIVQSLLDRVDAEARGRGALSVSRLEVRIGELAGIEVELLSTAFLAFRERTVCASAELSIRPIAARWVCPGCGAEIPKGGVLTCASCSVPARLAAGDEIILDRIEMEVP